MTAPTVTFSMEGFTAIHVGAVIGREKRAAVYLRRYPRRVLAYSTSFNTRSSWKNSLGSTPARKKYP